MSARQKVLIIGCGNMGRALAKGLLLSKEAAQLEIVIHDQHPERPSELLVYGALTIMPTLDASVALNYAAIVICIKPHDLEQLRPALRGRIPATTLVISILAGTSIQDLAETLDFTGAIVRSMPNIAATVLMAATGMAMNSACTPAHKALAETIFRGVGEAHWTKEVLLDAVTGLSGSGPAYIYMVIEALTDGGVRNGLPRDLSLALAVQTILGAATLVKTTGIHPAILKDQVTTPSGTTINALHELEARGLRSMFVAAVTTATERAKVLRQK